MRDTGFKQLIIKGIINQTLDGNPTVGTLQRIAGVLDCNVGDFFLDELESSSFRNGTLVIDGKEYDVLLKERK